MHIKSQREIFRQVAKLYCDDVYDFLQQAQWWTEGFLHCFELEFIDRQEEELTKWLKDRLENWFWRASNMAITRDDLEKEFIFWVEKNRGRPLDMGEMWDISVWAEDWAKNNGYGYLYED
jgi:hypothetical protein